MLFIGCSYSYSQKIFRDAYIVKNNGDILNGLVEYSINKKTPTVCVFKRFDIAMEIKYKPGEIQEFGYIYGNRYITKKIDNKECFCEVLVSGKITLYQKGSKYFLQKEASKLTEVKDGSIEYMAGGVTKEFDRLHSFLKYITEDKAGSISKKFNPGKDLVPLIAEYNNKSGESYVVYNQQYSEQLVVSELNRTGVNRNRFGVIGGLNVYSMSMISESNFYYPDPSPEFALTAGLFYEKALTRKNNRYTFIIELLYLRQTFYAYSERIPSSFQIVRDDAFFDFTGIKLPLLFKYSFNSGKISPFISGGFSTQVFIDGNYLHIMETEYTNTNEINTSEDTYFTINPFEISSVCAAGLRLRFMNNTILDIQGRVEFGTGLFDESEDVKEYRQHSLQPSMLIGFSF